MAKSTRVEIALLVKRTRQLIKQVDALTKDVDGLRVGQYDSNPGHIGMAIHAASSALTSAEWSLDNLVRD